MILVCGCNPKDSRNSPVALELDRYFSQQFPAEEPGGAVLLINGDSVIFSKGYGLANMETKEPVTTNTLFNLGSISKTFVASSILMLHDQGKLSLEDSLFRYFPTFKNKSIAQKVKIKHLLTHTSGLPDIRNVEADTVFYLTAKDQENWAPIQQADSLLFEPGSEFQYSNPAFNGLALIVEQVGGVKWQKFVNDNIFRPSAMESSTITDGDHPKDRVSHGYVKNHGKWIEDDYGEEPTFPAAGNGGVWSSVEELAKYEKALQTGAFLSVERVEDARTPKKFRNWKGIRRFSANWSWFTPQVYDGVMQPFIGWSWFVGTTADGSKIVGHTGTQGGFIANYVSIPQKKVLIVILCNSPRDVYAFTDKILGALDIDH
ncbi:serine hydrolase domain-containing protein [Chryseolinea sp. T2]|uniref:serine hydrolase domain-containing protein n=1 Tax=Chryseolinea sp. T2 TaxID=3129255 RepID=UPI003077D647